MIQMLVSFFLAFGFFTHASAQEAQSVRASKPAFKGYELYSWQDANGFWWHSLLLGTNRLKTDAEIIDPTVMTSDLGVLKAQLSALAENEQVSWSIRYKEYPTQMVDTIKAHCKAAKIKLST